MINCLDTNKFSVFSDIPGHEAVGGGTIPPELCVTPLKPDIVIWDKKSNKLHLFELTCPTKYNIGKRHDEKTEKYSHFLTDLKQFNCHLTCFDISSNGYVSSNNHSYLHTLHKYCKTEI